MRVVVKIGGSLIEEAPQLVSSLVKEFGSANSKIAKEISEGVAEGIDEGVAEEIQTRKSLPISILIVPGGGMFADTVRVADEKFSFSAGAAHWMAILGMEQYAFYLKDKSEAAAIDLITDMSPGVSILFPYRLMRTEDPLPHTWDVTSDTIAGWVAKQIGAVFVKATDVDGIFMEGKLVREISANSFKGSCPGCIDPALPPFLLKNKMECLIVNGKYPERVVQAVYGKPVFGTTVKGNI